MFISSLFCRCCIHNLRFSNVILSRLCVLERYFNTKTYSRDELIWKSENNLYNPREKSTLYVSGKHAQRVYAILSPYLNLDYVIENPETMQYSISARNICVNFSDLLPKLKLLNDVQNRVNTIKSDLIKLEKNINQAKCQNEIISDEVVELITKKDEIVQHNKEMRSSLWKLEDEVISDLLHLPNRVHPDVSETDQVLRNKDKDYKQPSFSRSHVEIGINTGCLEFSPVSPTAYYLKGKAALLEFAIINFFSSHLQKIHFSRMYGPDFSKAAIIEGCGKDLYAHNECIPLKGEEGNIGQVLHLTGTASQESFAAALTRMRTKKEFLPLRYFINGRHYNAEYMHPSTETNLFSVVQSTKIEYFVATEQCDSESNFNNMIETISECYEKMDFPYRIVRVAASKLSLSESLRIQFELWSPSLNRYITCGNVSLHDDYLSKRLLMKYRESGTEKFLHTIGGTAVSAPVLIACIMENLQNIDGSFSIPQIFESFMI